MQITITARHTTEIPKDVETLAKGKIEKLDQYGHKIIGAHLILDQQKYLCTAELVLTTKGFRVVSKASLKGDLLSCIEEAVHKSKTQLRRHDAKQVKTARRKAEHRI